jgi:NAD(P)-dependent dehydrogenase (short-subunit alcohol dehydrogenase family)
VQVAGVSAIVTGGASGLGAAVARRLVEAGAFVVIADLQEETGLALGSELKCPYVPCDVRRGEDVARAVDEAERLAPLRIAVSCAGVGAAERTVGRDGRPHALHVFLDVLAVNLEGTFNLMRLAAARMVSSEPMANGGRGVLINTASTAAHDGQVGQLAYAASKGAVAAMTLPAARDLAPAGIRVCTISPGVFETPMFMGLPEAHRASVLHDMTYPIRAGQPDEFADAVLQLCTNDYWNAMTVNLDAGLHQLTRRSRQENAT